MKKFISMISPLTFAWPRIFLCTVLRDLLLAFWRALIISPRHARDVPDQPETVKNFGEQAWWSSCSPRCINHRCHRSDVHGRDRVTHRHRMLFLEGLDVLYAHTRNTRQREALINCHSQTQVKVTDRSKQVEVYKLICF